jgi:hypothetical protein
MRHGHRMTSLCMKWILAAESIISICFYYNHCPMSSNGSAQHDLISGDHFGAYR